LENNKRRVLWLAALAAVAIGVTVYAMLPAATDQWTDGKLPVHETTKPSVQPDHPPDKAAEPNPEDSSNPSRSTLEQELKLSLAESEQGMQIVHDGEAVTQSVFPADNNSNFIVHVIRRSLRSNEPAPYRKDAVVFNPETKELRQYLLARADVRDDYNIDSIVGVFGYIDDRRLIYISARGSEADNTLKYSIQTLDVTVGQQEVLFDDIFRGEPADHLASSWLNESKDVLMLFMYKGGAWKFDLKNRTSQKLERLFPNDWPFIDVHVSPNGEIIEYRANLYDLDGMQLNRKPIPNGKQYDFYYPLEWSPDSKYAAHGYTFDESEDHIVSANGGEYVEIAPQGFDFFDSRGKLLHRVKVKPKSNRHIEIVQWLPDEAQVVLREYELLKQVEAAPLKLHPLYKKLNLTNGAIDETDWHEPGTARSEQSERNDRLIFRDRWEIDNELHYMPVR